MLKHSKNWVYGNRKIWFILFVSSIRLKFQRKNPSRGFNIINETMTFIIYNINLRYVFRKWNIILTRVLNIVSLFIVNYLSMGSMNLLQIININNFTNYY